MNNVKDNERDIEIVKEKSSKEEQVTNKSLKEVIATHIQGVNPDEIRDLEWYKEIPYRYRLKPGDIVYNTNHDRFGIFIQPSTNRAGLGKVRFFKIGTKYETYTRDWYLDYRNLVLVKRKDKLQSGFVETKQEFFKRAGKTIHTPGDRIENIMEDICS
jgi:hypothetical protein